MRCLIIGTDKLGTAPEILKEKFGVTEILHCNGRERLKQTKNISLMVIYTGFANHGVVKQAKEMAKKNKIKTIYVNRGLSELALNN